MRIRTSHVSLQFSDTDRQHTADIEKIFDRAVERRSAWVTGTESGPGSGNTGEELVRIAREHNYRPWVPEHQAKGIAAHTDCWIAVREDLIKGRLNKGYRHVFPGSRQLDDDMDLQGRSWGPKGLVHVSFDTTYPKLGRIAIGVAHYLPGGSNPRSEFWELNEKLGKEIGRWAKEQGKGTALVFYAGDQNMDDDRNDEPEGDTFFGGPLTSTWDELEKWENTGHGVIDVIASYNRDTRVKALQADALNDRQFRLHTDHFYVESEFQVDPIKS